jgi:hypothetical protein
MALFDGGLRAGHVGRWLPLVFIDGGVGPPHRGAALGGDGVVAAGLVGGMGEVGGDVPGVDGYLRPSGPVTTGPSPATITPACRTSYTVLLTDPSFEVAEAEVSTRHCARRSRNPRGCFGPGLRVTLADAEVQLSAWHIRGVRGVWWGFAVRCAAGTVTVRRGARARVVGLTYS